MIYDTKTSLQKKLAIGYRIRDLREANSISQLDYSEMLGLQPQSVSKWERGLTMPPVEDLQVIAETLGVDAEDAPAVFEGCCGAGGAVSAFNYEESGAQTQRKLEEVPDGGTVVTMCPTCTYTYAYRLMSAPRNIVNKHYTELLFESQFDWDMVFYQLNSMWYGEYGAWLAEVFA